ncbi:hypothetical protein Lsai_1950 [Legionella sainthelensi]|uniref:Uncharacterized protein n=1 Tax=Legionella sainthelensi TaxID=28087 RepID=A0A0W0YGZ8_9GAMM|nr:hypothetical protein [Legionella sainthelensi]KTD56233.1 hypothetical protein Lsai_1950 [Legionella sainthelensi]VEH31813.1 Uncharacterised protein [Legionella sainthelensi]
MTERTKDASKKSTSTKTDRFIDVMNKIEKQNKTKPEIEKKPNDTNIYDSLAEIAPTIDDELERYFNDEEHNANKSFNRR